jgi:hypothetical protein
MLVAQMEDGGGVCRNFALMGSCRVYEPVYFAPPSPHRRMIVSHFAPFTYSPAESLQYFRYCSGRLTLPARDLPLIFSDGRVGPAAPDDLVAGMATTQLCVVEISTLDQLTCGGLYYNWNEVGLHFIRGKGPAYLRWWREVTDVNLRAASAEAVEQVLETMHSNGEDVSADVEIFLRQMRFQTLSESELEQVLSVLLRESGKRFLFVSHLNLARQGPDVLADRRHLLQILRGVAARLGQGVFDPTPTVEKFGYRQALLGNGADTHHYTPEFKPILGAILLEAIGRTLLAAER